MGNAPVETRGRFGIVRHVSRMTHGCVEYTDGAMQIDDIDSMVLRARKLRRSMTAAERLLWDELRDRRLCGAKFERMADR